MFKTLSFFTVVLLLQGCEGKIDSKSSDDNASSAVEDDTRTPSQPVGNTPLIINGHTLPPEPDPKINNATLLGVDVNHNDVRDDVERWIYMTYKEKHPIYIDIAMQAARGYKLVLEHPERAREIYPILDAVTWCESYYMIYAKYFNEPLLVSTDIDTQYFRHKIYFNTKERIEAYEQYDTLLSGDTYSTPAVNKNMTSYCDFNVSNYEE